MKKLRMLLMITFLIPLTVRSMNPTEFVILTPTYNNEKWCIKNIESVLEQTYPHWHQIIISDCSTDRTSELLHKYIDEHHVADKIMMIDNVERKGALRNLYEAIHASDDNVVIVTLDGDDWMAGPHVLARLAKEYADPSVWITYGQFMWWPAKTQGFCRKFPDEICKKRLFRGHDWVSSHMRTFKAWLFKKIKKEDLLHEGKFFPVTWDLGMMFPMLEMASDGHIRFIPDVLYIYNAVNPLSDFRQQPGLQQWLNGHIRKKSLYEAL
jgi:glycosyltransferase involved in cell wall biosynthesis